MHLSASLCVFPTLPPVLMCIFNLCIVWENEKKKKKERKKTPQNHHKADFMLEWGEKNVYKCKQNAVKGNKMVNHELHEIKCVSSFASLKRREKKSVGWKHQLCGVMRKLQPYTVIEKKPEHYDVTVKLSFDLFGCKMSLLHHFIQLKIVSNLVVLIIWSFEKWPKMCFVRSQWPWSSDHQNLITRKGRMYRRETQKHNASGRDI